MSTVQFYTSKFRSCWSILNRFLYFCGLFNLIHWNYSSTRIFFDRVTFLCSYTYHLSYEAISYKDRSILIKYHIFSSEIYMLKKRIRNNLIICYRGTTWVQSSDFCKKMNKSIYVNHLPYSRCYVLKFSVVKMLFLDNLLVT